MQIEINEPGSLAFYREVVNVLSQHRKLLKKPEAKLSNQFRQMKTGLILCGVMLLAIAAMNAAWGVDTLGIIAMALLAFAMVLDAVYLLRLNRLVKGLMARQSKAVLTIDEQGVELSREEQSARLSWSTIAFVRVFEESLCFVPREAGSVMISVDRRYAAQVLEALHEQGQSVSVY